MNKYIAPETTTVNIRVENSIMSAGVNRNGVINPFWEWDEED